MAGEIAAPVRGAAGLPVTGGGGPVSWADGLVERTADASLAAMRVPLRILDVGCGAGALLREMVIRVPYGEEYVGVEFDPEAIARARRAGDPRLRFRLASPASLPFDDASFDLVVATAGADRWPDQAAGVSELARVVADAGRVVLVERSTRSGSGARRPRAVGELLDGAGLRLERCETLARVAFTVPTVRAYVAAP